MFTGRMKKLAFSLMLSLVAAIAADLPPLVFPEGVGVNIHFTRGHERDLDMIRDAGFKFIRMDLSWGGTERKKGEYDFSAYDELTANLEKRGIRALYILDYGNSLYEEKYASTNPITKKAVFETASPQHPESVAAFARWAAAAAKHFKGKRVIWEIWNEPNIFFWKPKPNADQYATLAVATAKAVREADPDATIIGPATSEFPWPFLETFLKSDVLDYIDAVSVHPYRNKRKTPETAVDDYVKLRALIETHGRTPAQKKLPIISGEWGYSSHTKNVSELTQAVFFARQQIANVMNGILLSIWYDWKNDGTDPNENEHNFGTVTHDLKPKLTYNAAQTLTRELKGFRILRREDIGNTNDFVLTLRNQSGASKIVAWTLGEEHTVRIHGAKVADVLGAPIHASPKGDFIEVSLTGSPIYVSSEK
jgi:polysaccharide biosynthesis protein PslG